MMRSITILFLLLLISSCGFKRNQSHKPAENPAPVVRVEFEDVDVNNDQVIDREEYISEVRSIYHDETMLAFVCVTGAVLLIVVILSAVIKKQ